MDDARRSELQRKRAALGDRLALAPINALTERLAAQGCRAEMLLPDRSRAILGELIDVPCEDERVSWDKVPSAEVRLWTTDAQRNSLALKAVARCAAADARVAVIWNPGDPALTMSVESLEAGIGMLLDEAPETWIVAAEGDEWLVECATFDHEICWSTNLMRGIGQKV